MKQAFAFLLAIYSFISPACAQKDAQKNSGTQKSRGWICLSPQLSAGSGSYHNPDLPARIDNGAGLAIQGGCTAGYMLNEHIGFFSGLQFTSHAFSNTITDSLASNRFMQTTGYLELPLYARFISARQGNIGFITEAGIAAGILLTSELRLKVTDKTSGNSYVQRTKEPEGLNKGAFSGFVFAGMNIPVSNMAELMPGLDYQYYISRFSDNPAYKEHLSRLAIRITINIRMNH